MSKVKKEKLPCNLIINDLLQYNAKMTIDNPMKQGKKTYHELQVVQTANGIEEKLVEVDYPITSEYVTSFEQSANYKNDVDGAIANSVAGKNLGDITDYQKLLDMDTELISSLADRLKVANAKIAEINAAKTAEHKEVKENV